MPRNKIIFTRKSGGTGNRLFFRFNFCASGLFSYAPCVFFRVYTRRSDYISAFSPFVNSNVIRFTLILNRIFFVFQSNDALVLLLRRYVKTIISPFFALRSPVFSTRFFGIFPCFYTLPFNCKIL